MVILILFYMFFIARVMVPQRGSVFQSGLGGDVFILISYLKVYIHVNIVIDNFYFPIAIIFNVIRKVYSMTLDKIFFLYIIIGNT